jgi:hypothetical protein
VKKREPAEKPAALLRENACDDGWSRNGSRWREVEYLFSKLGIRSLQTGGSMID